MAEQGERHASWLELFFDLVAVAGVAQLSHLVHGTANWADAGLYVVCFLAFWTAWMCFTVYGNVAASSTRVGTVLAAMLGLAVMAAAVGAIHDEDRARVFAIAYVAARVLSDRAWHGRSTFLLDWPVAQVGAGVVPWIVSLWIDEPWRYYLWAVGLAIDLVVMFSFDRERMERAVAEAAGRGGRAVTFSVARLEGAHFGERLGLFVIIVLGEGVLLVTEAMSELDVWDHQVYATVIGSLVLLAGLWGLALPRGFGGVPMLSEATPPRTLLLLHCVVAGVLAALAAGLGDLVHGHVEASTRWMMCAIVAAFGLLAAGAAAARRGWLWSLRLLLPALVVPAVAALLHTGAPALVWLLVLTVVVQLVLTREKVTRQ